MLRRLLRKPLNHSPLPITGVRPLLRAEQLSLPTGESVVPAPSQKNTLKLIVTACLLLIISACSSNDDTNTVTNTDTTTTKITTQLPPFIQNIADLNVGSKELKTYISIDDGTFEEMEIDQQLNTSKITKKLSKHVHTIIIKFEYTDGIETLLLCISEPKEVNLADGKDSLTLDKVDYICGDNSGDAGKDDSTPSQYDDDGDGRSNLREVLEGTNPNVFNSSDEPITPALIIIRPNNTSVTVGLTQTLTATIIYYSDNTSENITNRATWTSDNASIASVDDNGIVTGVAVGTTSINVTLQNDTTFQSSVQIKTVAAASEACKLDGTSTLGSCKLE